MAFAPNRGNCWYPENALFNGVKLQNATSYEVVSFLYATSGIAALDSLFTGFFGSRIDLMAKGTDSKSLKDLMAKGARNPDLVELIQAIFRRFVLETQILLNPKIIEL